MSPPKPPPLHPLGKNGPLVPAMGLGLMGIASHYGPVPDDEVRMALLDRAHELGCTFWDSADLYGDSEELIGKWFKRTGKRDDIFLSTKFGYVKGKGLTVDSSAAYCKKACAESLSLLNTDVIDLYWLHNANPDTPIEETMRALVELQQEGKIKHIGLSTVSAATLRRACKIAPVAAIQTEYAVLTRDIETATGHNLLAVCRELGVAIVAVAPLGRGILTAKFGNGDVAFDQTDARPRAMPRFQGDNLQTNIQLARRFAGFADKKGCTVTQLALAWLLKQGDDIFPIPGTKQIKYLEDNWHALDVKLSDEEAAEIREFAESVEIAGPAAPPKYQSYIYRDTKEEEKSI